MLPSVQVVNPAAEEYPDKYRKSEGDPATRTVSSSKEQVGIGRCWVRQRCGDRVQCGGLC
jgi:hypothetical protein